MNKFVIVTIALLVGCDSLVSCKKEVVEILVFENIKPCECDVVKYPECKTALSDRFEIKNVLGTVMRANDKSIFLDFPQNITVDEIRFPVWKKRLGGVYACNLPIELQNPKEVKKVKFDCILFYEPLPAAGLSVPASDGYSVELTRIEILQ
jgi:hypothetical protein